ncbi:hypothetical protein LguiA_025991 [Lonicera macranthoides]
MFFGTWLRAPNRRTNYTSGERWLRSCPTVADGGGGVTSGLQMVSKETLIVTDNATNHNLNTVGGLCNNRASKDSGENSNSPAGIFINQDKKSMENEEENRRTTDGPNTQLGHPQPKEQIMIDEFGQGSTTCSRRVLGARPVGHYDYVKLELSGLRQSRNSSRVNEPSVQGTT